MDGRRFDAVTKRFVGAGVSRRHVVKGLAGGLAAAGGLALLGAGRAEAARPGRLARGDPGFTRCGGNGGQSYHYDAHTYQHGGGPLSISLAAKGKLDSYLYLYTSFAPGSPCDNLWDFDDDSGCRQGSYISLPDLAAGTYTVVATTYAAGATGGYTLAYNVPQPCPSG